MVWKSPVGPVKSIWSALVLGLLCAVWDDGRSLGCGAAPVGVWAWRERLAGVSRRGEVVAVTREQD